MFSQKKTMINSILMLALVGGAASVLAAGHSGVKGDGDLGVPADYKSWSKFVPTVDKAKAGQVREIYINDTGLKAKRGGDFPYGTEPY